MKNKAIDKIVDVFFEVQSEGIRIENKEKLDEKGLNKIRDEIGTLNITRLYEYDSLIMTFNQHKNIYELVDILDDLWLKSMKYFKKNYSIDEICDILHDISDDPIYLISLGIEKIVEESKNLVIKITI